MNPRICCLAATPAEIEGDEGVLVLDSPGLDERASDFDGIVLRSGSEARAVALLEAGAAKVYVGEAALLDGSLIERLVGRFGGQRLGIYVPVGKMEVNWSFETVSNADFKVVAPSLCEPAWDIRLADGSPTGTLAGWWIKEMVERGVGAVLVQTDLPDDADLNLAAGLVEWLGDRVGFAPPADSQPALPDWVAYGQVKFIALPTVLYRNREVLLAPPIEREAA